MAEVTEERLKELEVAAKDLPWGWILRGYAGEHEESGAYFVDGQGNHVLSTASITGNNFVGWERYNAVNRYVQLATPTAMLELIAEIRRLRKELGR